MRRVVIVSDCSDVALNEMRGVMHQEWAETGRSVPIEPLVVVDHFSEVNASFLTRLVAKNYPAGTVIYTLVSKSHNLRSSHQVVWGETLSGHIFIGSNFGYFGWLVRDLGLKRMFEIRDIPPVNFSGRTYIAPIVARIAAEDESQDTLHPFGEELLDDVPMSRGTVVHVDNFGNVKVLADLGAARDNDVLDLELNGRSLCHSTVIETQVYLQRVQGVVVMYRSTSFDSMTDIAMVRGNFADRYGVRVGDVLTWR